MAKIEKLIYANERGETIEFSHVSIFHTNMKDVTGLSDIRNAIYSFNSMGQDGDTYLGNRIQSREIDITGSVNAKTKDETINKRRWLNHVLNPQLNATLRYEYGDFSRIIDCKVDNAPIFKQGAIFLNFSIQLLCLNPFWRELQENRADIASWIGCLEFPLEILEEGIQFGYREPSVIVNVYNGGDVECGMTIEFRSMGTVTNPSLHNVDTGEFIKFNNLVLSSGEVLFISTYYGKKQVKIFSNGLERDGFRYFDIDSTYLQLAVGDNLLKYDAETNLENLEVTIHHNNLYSGV